MHHNNITQSVKSVRTNDLFMMNATRQPHCYLQFYLGDDMVCESGVQESTLRPDWSEESLQFSVRGVVRSVRCDVMVKNFVFSDVLLGRVDIPLISLDMLKDHEQAFLIDCR